MSVTLRPHANPFLGGNKWPIDDELDVPDLPVTGQLPAGLRGDFLRNGPNPVVEPGARYHLFDGDGMIHAVRFEDGRARYRNRWVRTPGFELERAAGRAMFGGMTDLAGTDPEAMAAVGPMKNVANTHVVTHAGKVLALWEAGGPFELTRDADTVGAYDFCGRLAGAMTAHPKVDPVTGEMLFFGYSPLPPYLRYHVVDAQGQLVRSVDIDLPQPVMMHDFAITERYAVFLDAPAVFDLAAGMAGEPFVQWRPDAGCRVGVLPRDASTAEVRWFEVEPGYVFHFMNAFEDGDKVHLDGCRQPALNMAQTPEERATPARTALTRFTVDFETGRAGTTTLDDRFGDFPRVADAVVGRANRYGYIAFVADSTDDFGDFDAVAKYDHRAGVASQYVYGPGRTTGEVVFAADPDGSGEDDGWLLSFVHDATTDLSDLVVLDARDPAAGPVAAVHMPRRVPFGFHGSWMPTVDD